MGDLYIFDVTFLSLTLFCWQDQYSAVVGYWKQGDL